MLQSMRQLAHTPVVKGLMLFLIVSFSIWGIGDIFRGNPLQKTVAKAGKTVIPVQDLMQSFDRQLSQARATIDPDLTAVQAKQMGLLDKTLDSMIKRDLIDQDIKRLGIDVTPEAVLNVLADQSQFRAKDGSFNKELFLRFLQEQGMTERGFIAQGQQDMSRQQLVGALAGTGTVPQTVIDALYKAEAQKRILDVVTIDGAKMGDLPAPSDKQLHDYYEAHAKDFTAPEYRSLTIAVLSTDSLGKDIAISDDDVRKQYEAKKAELGHPEQRDLLQVVLQDEGKAKALAAAARDSGDLAATAKKFGDTAVPLEHTEDTNLMQELAKPVFAAAQGAVLDPIKTQLGWHVVEVKKIIPAGVPDFASVKDKLREDMKRDSAVESATRDVNKLDDELAAGHALEDIADELKLRLIKIPAVDATGLTPEGKQPPEMPGHGEVVHDGFAENAGETSPVEDDKAGTYFVTRADDVTPSAVKPFDSVKEKVAAAYTRHAEEARAANLAVKITEGLKLSKPLSAFDSEPGVSTRQSTPVSELGDTDALLPPALVAKALHIRKGEIAADSDHGKQIVIRVASIIDADPAKDDPRKGQIESRLKEGASEDLTEQYLQHLTKVFAVKIDNDLLDQLRQQE
ncbi:MAG: SurA N-terminal domain-containing protein [Alphaproteobacteria bacterium]|nr:SurA N-terminal domain-containing protein [Alphaproteobacteria bacterium]